MKRRRRSRVAMRLQKRKQAARRYAALRQHAPRCPWRQGRNVCGGLLEITVDRNGRTVTRCPRCVRRERGLCQGCPRPVESGHRLSLWCAECKYRRKLEIQRRYYHRHRPEKLKHWRQQARDWRARHPEYMERNRQEVAERRRQKKLRILRSVVA